VGIGLATAADVAELYGVSVSWVYANKRRLGAVLLDDGPEARLRFDFEHEAERRGGAVDHKLPANGRFLGPSVATSLASPLSVGESEGSSRRGASPV
jgi:hypothetical protein